MASDIPRMYRFICLILGHPIVTLVALTLLFFSVEALIVSFTKFPFSHGDDIVDFTWGILLSVIATSITAYIFMYETNRSLRSLNSYNSKITKSYESLVRSTLSKITSFSIIIVIGSVLLFSPLISFDHYSDMRIAYEIVSGGSISILVCNLLVLLSIIQSGEMISCMANKELETITYAKGSGGEGGKTRDTIQEKEFKNLIKEIAVTSGSMMPASGDFLSVVPPMKRVVERIASSSDRECQDIAESLGKTLKDTEDYISEKLGKLNINPVSRPNNEYGAEAIVLFTVAKYAHATLSEYADCKNALLTVRMGAEIKVEVIEGTLYVNNELYNLQPITSDKKQENNIRSYKIIINSNTYIHVSETPGFSVNEDRWAYEYSILKDVVNIRRSEIISGYLNNPKEYELLETMGQYGHVSGQRSGNDVIEDLKCTALLKKLLMGKSLTGMDLSGMDLRGSSFYCSDLSNVVFNHCRLSYSDMSYAILARTRWIGVEADSVLLTGSDLSGAVFGNVSLDERACLENCILSNSVLRSPKLDGTCLLGIKADNVTMIAGELIGCPFDDSTVEDVVFQECYIGRPYDKKIRIRIRMGTEKVIEKMARLKIVRMDGDREILVFDTQKMVEAVIFSDRGE